MVQRFCAAVKVRQKAACAGLDGSAQNMSSRMQRMRNGSEVHVAAHSTGLGGCSATIELPAEPL